VTSGRSSDRLTVLVVDDEPKVARLIRLTLGAEGYEVLQAADGAIGVEMVERERPDLVLLDLMMPRMDGFQACQRIRELSDVPIVLLTARGAESDRIRGLDLGADDYVVKPFSPGELAARVRAILRRARPEAPAGPAYDDGELRIDFERREVTRGGAPVALSRTELRLLDVLAQNPGRVFLHEELRNRVWGEEYRASSEQLRTYIKYLRRKIEPHPSEPRYILTQPGVGYVFRPARPAGTTAG
jgi:two-component system KDP operon response regulator KdpE